MESYKDLVVYQKAYKLVLRIYLISKEYPNPKEEIFGLTSQMRRNAVSISCNIAAGIGASIFNFSMLLGVPAVSLKPFFPFQRISVLLIQ